MKRWLIGLVLFAFAGCGGDDPPPTGPVPNQRSIKLEITWPLATHPSMDTPQYWESQGSSCSGQWNCPGGGSRFFTFDSEGVVLTSFMSSCTSGETNSNGYVMALNTETDTHCQIPVDWICQAFLQQILVETPEDDPDCQVTPE